MPYWREPDPQPFSKVLQILKTVDLSYDYRKFVPEQYWRKAVQTRERHRALITNERLEPRRQAEGIDAIEVCDGLNVWGEIEYTYYLDYERYERAWFKFKKRYAKCVEGYVRFDTEAFVTPIIDEVETSLPSRVVYLPSIGRLQIEFSHPSGMIVQGWPSHQAASVEFKPGLHFRYRRSDGDWSLFASKRDNNGRRLLENVTSIFMGHLCRNEMSLNPDQWDEDNIQFLLFSMRDS